MVVQFKALDEFMAAWDSDAIAHDMETVNEGLSLLVQGIYQVAMERQELSQYVERDNMLRAKANYYADMKSALQSIQRTLREV